MHTETIDKAAAIIAQNSVYGLGGSPDSYCTIALIDEAGYPTASTITVSRSDGIRELTFCTGLAGNKAKRIGGCNRASVCFNQSGRYNITLVGTIEVVTDPAVKQAMWYEGMGQHFSGPEDPDYCVLRFQTERYNLFVDFEEAMGTL